MKRTTTWVVALLSVGALLVGGGIATAGNGPSAQSRCDALLAKIAEKRGMPVEQLQAALEARALARIDAAAQAGRITADQAAKARAAVEQGRLCKGLRHGPAAHGARGMLAAAAGYLGLSGDQLRAELRGGKSLGEVAVAKGKTVGGLKAAMLAPASAKLDQAVAHGRISAQQRTTALARLGKLADRLIAKKFGAKS
jgi:hypothetical protein